MENAKEYTVTITAIDVQQFHVSSNIQQLLGPVLHCKHAESTGGLTHLLQATVTKQYDITAYIFIEDGLSNGAHCSITYMEHENSKSSVPSII